MYIETVNVGENNKQQQPHFLLQAEIDTTRGSKVSALEEY